MHARLVVKTSRQHAVMRAKGRFDAEPAPARRACRRLPRTRPGRGGGRHLGAALVDALQHSSSGVMAPVNMATISLRDVHPLRVNVVDCALVDDRLGRVGVEEFLLLRRPLGGQAGRLRSAKSGVLSSRY